MDFRGTGYSAVVPLVGTWIEIDQIDTPWVRWEVVPLVGTWIEIENYPDVEAGRNQSSPSWGRGLKSYYDNGDTVTYGRPPRGDVD